MWLLNENRALIPLNGGVIRHAEYLVDPALSFAIGWNKVYSGAITLPAEISAAAVIVGFWKQINNAVWISVFGVLVLLANMILVTVYGELEFIFAILKILLVIGQNLMALVLTCGGGPDHHTTGFQFWRHPGPFMQFPGVSGSWGRFLAFWSVFSSAIYSYGGIDDITAIASETQAPRRNIPMAAKRIFFRVIFFYSTTLFMMGLVVSPTNPHLMSASGNDASSSPFVIAAKQAGIHAVPSIINFVVLTSAWSAANEGLLGSSRMLYGLARHGRAPRMLGKANRFGVPYWSVGIVGLFVCLAYMTVSSGAATVFNWFQELVSSAILVAWIIITIVYLRFYHAMRVQGISRDELPWKGPMQPYAAAITCFLLTIILLTGGFSTFMRGRWSTHEFIGSYLDIGIVTVLYVGYKLVYRTKIISLEEMPIRRFIDIANANPEPPPRPKRGLHKLNILWS